MKSPISYPWRQNNRFTLLVDSDAFYPEMLQAIARAKSNIILEQYLIQPGKVLKQFFDHLIEAASRGVKIYILLDDYGAKDVPPEDLKNLDRDNISLVHYNPFRWTHLYKSLRRNHRKLLLIDNKIAFVGGAGISDEYQMTERPIVNWHDIMLRVQGEVVHDWYASFKSIWRKHSDILLIENTSETDIPAKHNIQAAEPADGPHAGRVLLAAGPGQNHIIRSAINHIKKSQQRVWITTPYFLTTRKLRHAMIRAAKRGVDVRLLLPGAISDHPWISQAARRYYGQLLKNTVKIYEYQPRFIHTKLVICDDWVSIGSSNLDRWNQFWNLDANQAIDDPGLLQQVVKMFDRDLAESNLLDYQYWRHRPLLQRSSEWWSSYIVRLIQWLVFFSSRIKKKTG